ncbi:hypothetical protein KC332_g13380 [Hortaea werneckii]|nr:hypothetical protein KC358_g13263 [Hortaea werneckii]KAI6809484.1 hypothetical protein KC350_g12936 [Hortaea werneckii]KAI6832220.1 hypothetical protein KC342_g7436 [Hortaea werneckii]KAI6910154.1 hypothetical protein KC348_g13314 [Hortaea werneckii]KAI6926153.1 hypothetical protein KC341_g12969 [Hortaea werneckii]
MFNSNQDISVHCNRAVALAMVGFLHFCWFHILVAHINASTPGAEGSSTLKKTVAKCILAFVFLFFFETSVNMLFSTTTAGRWITAVYALTLQAGYMWINRGTSGLSPATDARQDKPSSFGFEKEAEPSKDHPNVTEKDHECKSQAHSTQEEGPMNDVETQDASKEIEPTFAKRFRDWRVVCDEFFSHSPGSRDLPLLPSKALLAELLASTDNLPDTLKQEARRWHPNRAFFHQMEAAGRLGAVKAATEMFQAIQNIRDERAMK